MALEFQKYLDERYFQQLNYYNNAALLNKKRYKSYQLLLIIFSALAPVCAALGNFKVTGEGSLFSYTINILVVVVSSLVAILTTVIKTFNYHELWIKHRSTYERLKPESYYYEFRVGQYAGRDTDKEATFVSRVENILNSEHAEWNPTKS